MPLIDTLHSHPPPSLKVSGLDEGRPSVIVGDMAGIPNFETAFRTAVMCIPVAGSASTTHRVGMAFRSHCLLAVERRAALETWWRDCIFVVEVVRFARVDALSFVTAD